MMKVGDVFVRMALTIEVIGGMDREEGYTR